MTASNYYNHIDRISIAEGEAWTHRHTDIQTHKHTRRRIVCSNFLAAEAKLACSLHNTGREISVKAVTSLDGDHGFAFVISHVSGKDIVCW